MPQDEQRRLSYMIGDNQAGQIVQANGVYPFPVYGPKISAPSNVAYATNLVVKTTSGRLFGFTGYNSKASAQFILVFDGDAVPAAGAIPIIAPITVPASSNFAVDFGIYGIPFGSGCVITNSSVATSLTIGSADCWFTAQVDNFPLGVM